MHLKKRFGLALLAKVATFALLLSSGCPEFVQALQDAMREPESSTPLRRPDKSNPTPKKAEPPKVSKNPPKLRSRAEILALMVDNGSFTQSEARDMDRKLSVIKKYAESQRSLDSSDFRSQDEKRLLGEVINVVRNVKAVRGFFPRETQIIATLEFLKGENRLLQAATGQGKSLIVAMTAIVQSKLKLSDKGQDSRPMAVHIVTPTDNLSEAGLKENEELYAACGVKARLVRTKGRSSDIVYGTPYDFEGLSLEEASDMSKPRNILDPKVRRTVILDESDSHLIDGATGRVIYSDPDPDRDNVKRVLKAIAKAAEKDFQDFSSKARATREDEIYRDIEGRIVQKIPGFMRRYKQDGHTWVQNALMVYDTSEKNPWKNGVRFVVKSSFIDEMKEFRERIDASKRFLTKYDSVIGLLLQIRQAQEEGAGLDAQKKLGRDAARKLSEVLDLMDPKTLHQDLRSQYERFDKMAKELYLRSQAGNKESVFPYVFYGQVQYLNVETGQIVDRMAFKDGVQEFLEQKFLGTIIHEPSISFRSYSLFKYVRLADVVLGLSGTVGVSDDELMAFQKHVWNVRHAIILPEFAVSRLKNVATKIHAKNEQSWLSEITKVVNQRTAKQPILIIAENPKRAWSIKEHLEKADYKILLYAEMTDEHLLDQHLGPNQIIVTTNLGGRGSDYKVDEDKAPEGLHVILAFDSNEERILLQARGRGGRAGEPGTWQQIAFGQPLNQKPNIAWIKKGLESTLAEDMMMEIYMSLMTIADNQSWGSQKESTRLVQKWVSDPVIRSEMIDRLLEQNASVPSLVNRVFDEFKEFLGSDASSAGRSFLSSMKGSEPGARAQLSKDLGQSRFELLRIRKAP